VNTYYKVENAKVICSLDSDFLTSGPGHVRYAREFAKRGAAGLNLRLYSAESTPTNTGAKADHRFPMRAAEVQGFAIELARQLGVKPVELQSTSKVPAALVADLKNNAGASLVVAGEGQPPTVHALAQAMNHALGNVGKTVIHTEPLEASPVNQVDSLRELIQAMDSGSVELLVILSANPVYNTPADLPFAERLAKVKLRIRLGLYDDETS